MRQKWPMHLWVLSAVHDLTWTLVSVVAKCNYEGTGLSNCVVHHELVLTFHDRCVKCVCPTAALVAESRAFRLVKSRTIFKLAHTLMIWCKTET